MLSYTYSERKVKKSMTWTKRPTLKKFAIKTSTGTYSFLTSVFRVLCVAYIVKRPMKNVGPIFHYKMCNIPYFMIFRRSPFLDKNMKIAIIQVNFSI